MNTSPLIASEEAPGPVETRIGRTLEDTFHPQAMQVLNESGMHSVPPGSETHFKVLVVSQGFAGEGLLARHRRVHAALAEELRAGVHALSIHAFTPEEWEAKGRQMFPSPRCHGGSKGAHGGE